MSQRAFKNYGKIDVTPFKKILSEGQFDWDEFDVRQKKYDVHKETKSIPLIYDEINTERKEAWQEIKNGNMVIQEKMKTKYYDAFKKELYKIESHLKEIIEEEGFIFRAMLVNLPKGKTIPSHYDKGVALTVPRRIHIPIITNKDCLFTVGDITKNMKEGEIWEIDNAGKKHSVENNGKEDRIHLIIDFLNN
jgi:quercetin dioxygenase-like cupin family protein